MKKSRGRRASFPLFCLFQSKYRLGVGVLCFSLSDKRVRGALPFLSCFFLGFFGQLPPFYQMRIHSYCRMIAFRGPLPFAVCHDVFSCGLNYVQGCFALMMMSSETGMERYLLRSLARMVGAAPPRRRGLLSALLMLRVTTESVDQKHTFPSTYYRTCRETWGHFSRETSAACERKPQR